MLTINVCIGSACHLKGAYNVINKLQEIIKERKLEDKVVVKGAFCLGECTKAVSVKIDEGPIISVSEETVDDFFEQYVAGRV
ncbi:(2Fe-2S) ferredoxin domain-containing protein [Caloranaerobacter azorensis]|uniref:NADH dehydrogenase n=2 Tax=Caloranaerobacter azorensis TaxID=116090 RepID=A0A096BJS1_9FIRM|nr:NAD(P)H-dependent oxidoreductase subunit E [Caloranaerobacter azorensis]KGG80998.1 NADH dehydrogenase [Caloranaerobacter azorensis H53214]QIB27689.1 (2Fe-2S) ferredoxin domain-containing protein [Caloranaerobacter azorensis]